MISSNNNVSEVKPLSVALELFSRWNSEGIRYCHWKSNEHLLMGLAGETDLDILLDEKFREIGCKILIDLGYIRLKSQYGSSYPFVEDWVGCDSKVGKLIHVHLHYRIVSGHKGLKEYTLPFTEKLLYTRVLDEKYHVYIAEPNLELVILYTRIGIKASYIDLCKARLSRYHVSSHDIKEVKFLKEVIDLTKAEEIASEFYKDKCNAFMEIIKRDSYDSKWILDLSVLASKNYKKYNRFGWYNPLLRIYYRIVLVLRKHIRHSFAPYLITKKALTNGGGVFVIVGQDGAGKSTMSNEVVEWLSWKLEAKRFYFGSGDGYKSLNRQIAGRIKGKKGLLEPLRGVLAISNYMTIAKRNYHKAKKVDQYVSKGGIAICDRFPQTKFLGINDGPKIRELKKRTGNPVLKRVLDYFANKEEKLIIKTLALKPDLVIKLMLPVEESLRRKPDENEEIVRNKNRIISELDFGAKKSVCVRADQDFQTELTEIHNHIWNAIKSRAKNNR